MATSETAKKIVDLATGLTSTPIDDLVVNKDKWGPLNFEAARGDLVLLFSLCQHLAQLPVELIPEGTAAQTAAFLEQCRSTLVNLKGFTIERSNPIGERDGIVNTIRAVTEQLLVHVQGWIAFLAYQKGDIQRNIEGLNTAVNTAKALVGKAQSEIAGKQKEIDDIIVAAREAAASVGVAHFTAEFSGKATSLEGEAATWLRWTAGLGAVTLLVAVISFFVRPLPDTAILPAILQYMTSKLVVLGVLITATIWCGRIYKALKHQAAVNAHRANALKTFQAFVKATNEPEIRDAVLVETTRSIFAITPSGYIDATESSPASSAGVLEFVKGASGGAGKSS